MSTSSVTHAIALKRSNLVIGQWGQAARLEKFRFLVAICAWMITPTHSLMQLKQNRCPQLVRNKLSSGVVSLHNMHSSMLPEWRTNKQVSLRHVHRFLEGQKNCKRTVWLAAGKVGRGGGGLRACSKNIEVIDCFTYQAQLDQLWLAVEQWWSWVPHSQQQLTMPPHHNLEKPPPKFQ